MAKKDNRSLEDMRYQAMFQAAMLGVKPEDYANFYEMANRAGGVDGDDVIGDADVEQPQDRQPSIWKPFESCACASADASEKTLILRVQMQDVIKPPMWRELKVPADFTFFQLHQAIQRVCGFYDAHLWLFQRKAYGPGLQIGVPYDPENPHEPGVEDCTHDARDLGITAYLPEKGRKLVYIYDFGDDWIFNVSVVDVVPRDGDTAECIRWKSELQPVEDSGGVWAYLSMRQAWTERDTLKKRQKEKLADEMGYDSFGELEAVLTDSLFDPEMVNEALTKI